MRIRIKFSNSIRPHLADDTIDLLREPVDVPDRSTVHQVLQRYGFPLEMKLITFVNGDVAGGDLILSDGDYLEVLPAVSGG